MLDLSFIYTGKQTFPDLVSMLVKTKDKAIFSSNLVTHLLNEFWDHNFQLIFRFQLLPFAFHLLFAMAFLILNLQVKEDDAAEWPAIVFGALGSVTWAILLSQEISQLRNKRCAHFKNMWNIVDMFHLSLFIVLLAVKVLPGDLISMSN